MKLYRIGEISKMLNVPVETIRFFEQKGLIVPQKNEENGYRYYNVWDVNRILDYKKYRQIGFSSVEAIDLIKECDISTLLEQLESKRMQYLMGHSDIGVTMNVYTHLGMEDAAAEMVRMEEVELARREQEKLNGVKEGKEKQSRKMFRVV